MPDPLTILAAETVAPIAGVSAIAAPPLVPPPPPALVPIVSPPTPPPPPSPPPALANPYAVPKTVADRARAFDEEHARAESSAREAASLREVVTQRAAVDLAALPSDAHRAAVREMAGDDPVAQLRAISALQRHGIVSSAIPAGATTGPAPSMPSAAPAAGDADLAIVRHINDLRTKGAHILAASLESQHAAAVARVRARPATN